MPGSDVLGPPEPVAIGHWTRPSATAISMGKLNIAHHKSYHPYRLDNVERVRLDEAAAKRKQTEDTDRALAVVRLFSFSPHLLSFNPSPGRRVPSECASSSCRYHTAIFPASQRGCGQQHSTHLFRARHAFEQWTHQPLCGS